MSGAVSGSSQSIRKTHRSYVRGAEMIEIAITDLIAIAISCVALGVPLTTIIFVIALGR